MGFDIRKKEKNEKAKEFVREMKERHNVTIDASRKQRGLG